MKHLLFAVLIISSHSYSQIPLGYYDSAAGLTGQPLRSALRDIIDDHEEQSYSSIWAHFQTTDDKPDGKVWDMYSDVPGGNPAYSYTFVIDQCGNYSTEGDCYNREHSFPKSWFNDAAPMVTDLFHIYPTDGYVNGQRSNYPFGETNSATWTSTNGSKVGNCSFPGYSGVIFEPIDEYKGDFSRTYFYMLTRYMNEADNWTSDMLYGNDLSTWAKEMLLEWHSQDPVSQKETERNNAVYQVQANRNPFIDHPEYTGLIWGMPSGNDEPVLTPVKIWYSDRAVHIESEKEINGWVRVLNINGVCINTIKINSARADLHFSSTPGIYMVIIETDQQILTYKMAVMK
jgi:endonuclease I